jgi:hypothetical protein
MAIQDLEKILRKDPVIHTFRPDELISNPEKVEENYSIHAETHMAIGDTDKYYERLCKALTINKTTFVGAVVGDYGEGKTSLMIYFWRRCEDDKIFAIPPYVWFNFQENFRVIYSWTRYRVNMLNEKLALKLDGIYKKYRDPSIEKIAQEDVQKIGGNYEALLKRYKERFEQGTLIIEPSEDDLLKFCSEVYDLVIELGYKGLLVFNDELEFTAEATGNSLNKTAGTLFKLGDSLINSQGNYGFFFGMARNFQSQLHSARAAVLDRLEKQNVFMRLSEIYGQDFPKKLWDKYTDYFDLGDIGQKVVAQESLESIGQVCDRSRRDLGNGPRSVISAFNRMVFVYNNYEKQYAPLDFVEDCLNNEITLGDSSGYARLVKELLADRVIRDTHEQALRFLAAYPKGCSRQIIKKYELDSEVDNLIKSTGLGKVVFDTGYGYALVKLQLDDVPQQSIADEMMRGFYSRYSAGKEDLLHAINAFREMIVPKIFQQKQGIEGWEWPNKWIESQGVYNIRLIGTFPMAKQYPERKISITIVSDINRKIPVQFIPEDLDFNFIFNLSASANLANESNSILRLADDENDLSKISFRINLLGGKYPVRLQLNAIPDNEKTVNPLFSLALLGYMEDKELPQSEKLEYGNLKQRLIKNIIISIFNEDMLKVDSLDTVLDNKGEILIPELFLFLCKKRFPDYYTLICQPQWENKVKIYSNVLSREDISLSVKRGSEPWHPARDASESRKIIASKFTISAANLASWMNGLESLVDYSKLPDGILTFRVHPLEKLIFDELEKCPIEKRREVKIDGKECQWLDESDILQIIMRLGYTREELIYIIGEIGKTRYSFERKSHYFPEEGRSFNIIYRKPVSIPELQENLSEKVRSLEKEYEYLEAIKGFNKKRDLDEFLRDIGKLSDEEDYEQIKHNLHGCFEINHRWISGKIEELKNSLDLDLNRIEKHLQQIQSSGYEGEIKRRVEGQTRWIATFRELIQEHLRKLLEEVKSGIIKLTKSRGILVNDYSQYSLDSVAIARDGAQKLYEFQGKVESLANDIQELERQIQNITSYLGYYHQWLQLIRRSDEIYDEALKIKTSPLYNEGGHLERHQVLSDEIEQHLRLYNVNGLGSAFEEYMQRLGELEKDYRNFYTEFKDAFITKKEITISFLKKISAPTNIVRESFNSSEPKESYDRLYDEAYNSIVQMFDEMFSDLKSKNQDIDYLFDILNKGAESGQISIKEQLAETEREANGLQGKMNREWLKDSLSSIDISQWTTGNNLPASMNEVIVDVDRIRKSIQKINKEYHKTLEPEEPNETEKVILDCFKRGAESNLKEIILANVSKEEDKSGKLEQVLDILKNLFKKNLIDIKVKKI